MKKCGQLLALAGALACTMLSAIADPTTLTVTTAPVGADVDVGEPCAVTITLNGSRIGQNIRLPKVDGLTLTVSGMYYDANIESYKFYVEPKHTGDFTIPSFDIKTQAGETLHVDPVKIHCPRRSGN